jgi:NADPH:quinone reductase-like Zn-dependent oxidoreductase
MENQAAYLFAANTRLEVKPSPLKMPRRGEVLIRNFAITISPLDVLRQDGGIALDRYPHVCNKYSSPLIYIVLTALQLSDSRN